MTTRAATIVNFMVTELAKSQDRNKVVALTAKNWQLSIRSFDRLWKIAKERYLEQQQEIAAAVKDKTMANALERAEDAVMSRNNVLDELYKDFMELKKMKAGTIINVLNPTTNEIIEVISPTPLDEVRAKQARLSIAEKIAELEGWGPAQGPQPTIIQNNVQTGNITTVQRVVNFRTRQTTIKEQIITEEPED